MLISIEAYRTCDFPVGGGSGPPYPPLDPCMDEKVQTRKSQIRLLLEEQYDQGLFVCFLFRKLVPSRLFHNGSHKKMIHVSAFKCFNVATLQ